MDKRAGRELLAAPAGLELFTVAPGPWPEWEIGWRDLSGGPRGRVGGPATVRVVESGPVRAAIEVSRTFEGSLVTQRIRLAAGEAGDRVEVDTRLDWNTPATLLKAAFPLTARNAKATYDLGVGAIQRGNATETLYEVPAQQWADITAADGSFGVAVLNDSKYGWDKPADGVLRLSLVHSPPHIEKEHGRHRFLYAVAGHRGDWRRGGIPALGARINQPLAAFQAPSHPGGLGKRLSMLRVSAPQVAVSALKMAEESREVIVRLFESHGAPVRDARLAGRAHRRRARVTARSSRSPRAAIGAGPPTALAQPEAGAGPSVSATDRRAREGTPPRPAGPPLPGSSTAPSSSRWSLTGRGPSRCASHRLPCASHPRPASPSRWTSTPTCRARTTSPATVISTDRGARFPPSCSRAPSSQAACGS